MGHVRIKKHTIIGGLLILVFIQGKGTNQNHAIYWIGRKLNMCGADDECVYRLFENPIVIGSCALIRVIDK